MIIADELDVDWKDVTDRERAARRTELRHPAHRRQHRDADQLGSAAPVRRAPRGRCSIAAAAQTWGVPAGECTTASGRVRHAASNRTLGYGELAARAQPRCRRPDLKTVKLKDPKDYKVIGSSAQNQDVPKIVRGEPLYAIDTKLPACCTPPTRSARCLAARSRPRTSTRSRSFPASATRSSSRADPISPTPIPSAASA